MVDVRFYRDATPITVSWPSGGCVRLSPLPLARVQGADVTTSSSAPGSRWMHRTAEIISQSISPHISAQDILDLLAPGQLMALGVCQMLVQKRATIDIGKLQEWIRKSVNDHSDVLEEAASAYHSESVVEFYDKPIRDLTPAQLTWFLGLQSAFDEFHVGTTDKNGKRKVKRPSPPWLRIDKKERLQWLIDC